MKSIKNNQGINKCLEYVEDESKQTFLNVIKDLDVKISEPEYKKHFAEDTEERNVYRVKLTRNGKSATIKFGQSIVATYKNEDPDLYDILTCVASDLTLDAENFEDFCADFGYDNDSIKAERGFKSLQKQNARVSEVISKEEAYSFPG